MIETLNYRLPWQSGSVFPGAHSGKLSGAGQLFKGLKPFIESPDPRRLDVRATLLDPLGNYRVRVYQQQTTINLYLLADLSASMSFAHKKQALINFLLVAADSAFSYGDKFGFIGCSDQIENQWLLPPSQHRGRIMALAESLKISRFLGSATALLKSAAYLSTSRSLVFLLSDFHFPISQLRKLLGSLKGHDVIPLVLWDQNENVNLPEWGWLLFQDLESNAKRSLFMRPGLRQKIIDSYQQRHDELKRCFKGYGFEALFIHEANSIATVNRYLQQRVA